MVDWKKIEMWGEYALRKLGYEDVHHARPSKQKRGGRWYTASNDVWGCINLMGTSDALPERRVQVCQTSGVSKHRRAIEMVHWNRGGIRTEALLIEIWEYRKLGFRVHRYHGLYVGDRHWTVLPELIPIE